MRKTKDQPPTPYRSEVNVIQRPWMYTACCLLVVHLYAKYGMPMSEQILSCPYTCHGENIILILRQKVKVIQRSWMYVTHRSITLWWYTQVSNMVWLCQRTYKLCPKNEAMSKTLLIDNWGQRSTPYCYHDVRDTTSYGDSSICQIWYGKIKSNSNGLDTNVR